MSLLYYYFVMNEREITKAIPLLGASGILEKEGFARHPLFLYNREMRERAKSHLKEWDYYTVFNPAKEYALSLIFAQFGSCPILSIGFADYSKGSCGFYKKAHRPKRALALETSSLYDSYLTFSDSKALAMAAITKDEEIHITVSCPYIGFPDGLVGLRAEFTLTRPRTKESLNTATRMKSGEKDFRLSEKVPALLVKEGYLIRDEKRDDLVKDGSVAFLDWERGCFAEKDSTTSASAAASSFTSAVTGIAFENGVRTNAFFTDDRLQTLGEIVFKHEEDIMKPWVLSDKEGKASLRFTPKTVREENGKNELPEGKQLFGYFDGTLKGEDGKGYQVSHMQGLIECR